MSGSESTHINRTRFAVYAFALLLLLPLLACGDHYAEVKSKRSIDVKDSETVNIAVIWDTKVKDFLMVEGVSLATEELNQRGGLFGRNIKLKVYYAKDDADEQLLARKIARDTTVSAVIGHRSTSNAVLASVTYEYYGMLYLSPSSSGNNLTNHGFEYVFRTIPSDKQVSREIAEFMQTQGQKKIAILDDRSAYGKEIADGVMESLADYGLDVVVRRHYSPEKSDYKLLCAELMRYEYDAMFIGGGLPQAAEFIREARQMGNTRRVYGGAAMDSRALERIAGDSATGTVVPTTFNIDSETEITKEFVANFKNRFHTPPDTRAALGYDSMKLIYEAMKRSKSTDPAVVASNLRFIRDFPGVTGNFSFDLRGNLIGRKSYFKYLNKTRFVYFDAPVKHEEKDNDTDSE